MDTTFLLPKHIVGTSCLGNLYQDIGYEAKKEIIREAISLSKKHSDGAVVLDSAGKYGCGLALETIGLILKDLQVSRSEVQISNKLGWRRVPLNNDNIMSCTKIEPGVWVDIQHDAVMDISYDGMLACFREGNELLGDYSATHVSVHDPDDYLDGVDYTHREERLTHILEAYRCLSDLKAQHKVKSVGIGVKNPRIVECLLRIGVRLDWCMIAGALTPHVHTTFTRSLLQSLQMRSIQVINAAVFNSGFLVGEDYYNYVLLDPKTNKKLYEWRDMFFRVCASHHLSPAHVCVQFSFLFSEVQSVALNACRLEHVALNFRNVYTCIPREHDVWRELITKGIVDVMM